MGFLILPDSAEGSAIAEAVPGRPTSQVITHASGRPWLVGEWDPENVVEVTDGPGSLLVLIGCTTVDASQLRQALARARTLQDLDALVRTVTGAAHALASLDGRVRAQGTVTMTHQVYYARVGGTTVAADCADALAALVGGGIDEELIARQLLVPIIPWPLAETPLWRGVHRLPGDCFLDLRPDGTHHAVRWWTPPEPDTDLRPGADALRSALVEAVSARSRRGGIISADLSGGMDSTSLCFLIGDSGPAELVTSRWEASDPAHDDWLWAERAAAELRGAEHLVTAPEDMPRWYADLAVPNEDPEAPSPLIRTQARQLAQVQQVAERGSTRHVTGHGGDELFAALPTYLHDLARSRPMAAPRHIRRAAALYRWKRLPTLRALLDARPYGQWLAASADSLTAAPPLPGEPTLGWGGGVRMPSWATPTAVETVRRMFRSCADAEPLARQRGQHSALEMARECGSAVRRVDRLTSRHGVAWHAPYVDDRVVEAALSISLADRARTTPYKPPLTAAMRGIVPDRILGRPTKAEFSAEAYAGLQRHKRELAELCDDLRLARMGLVDPEALRAAILGLHISARSLIPLDATLACESWLRSIPASKSTTRFPGGRR
ncbi:asparagine synthase-related protein [Streptomyces jumonjinensis]|uniref:asparagine synthase-related protein n=1 Tax=Streptomyces jumonjinensis TaxID=1945 RepID=UPI0037B1D128